MKKSIKSIVAIALLVVAGNLTAEVPSTMYFINKSSYPITVQELNGKNPSTFEISAKSKSNPLRTSCTEFKITSKPTTALIQITDLGVVFGKYDKQGHKPTSMGSVMGGAGLFKTKDRKDLVVVIDVGYNSPKGGVEAFVGDKNMLNSYKVK